ncbi:hypothetical protein JJB11_05010 [Ramlibacter ginsenosidimutans]|uniref:TonB-dependent receptor n=1 Tax=Ramlibacter ginsenosidimutans TaxID=502333 RepID=A0A934TQ24_9BURK|nr:hypothetical protein [Ramlibacter ginsenosidimutans]MBK6005442.1 hypothetical protein [Ramlibacter ginsenosidimutans]
MDHVVRRAGWILCLAAGSAVAQTASPPTHPNPDTQALRREIAAMRAEYEARIQALEKRVQAAEAAAAASPPNATAAAPAATAPAATTATAAPTGGGSAAGGGFQPALSLILSGAYYNSSQDPATYRIRGFSLPPDAAIGPGVRGFSLAESELGLAANIDPWFRGAANLSFAPDNTVSVEEAYVETTSLGHGLNLRAGRFFSNIGYLNPQHAHAWDFADAPLAYQAMLGTQFDDDGVRLTWLAPTEQFIELSAEAGRGRSYPGSDTSHNAPGMYTLAAHNAPGMYTLAAHTGGDIGDSSSWRAGLSYLHAHAGDQELLAFDPAGKEIRNRFAGSTGVWIADAVWKWAPNGNATRTNFKLQGEYLQSRRDGSMVVDTAGAASPGDYRATQSGWYLQGVYQFMPHWRFGLRTERLSPGTPDYGSNSGLVAQDSGSPSKNTLMLDWSPSEFSRWRFQLAQDRARAGAADTQWLIQYQMSLGAHGAHSY